MRSDFSFKTKQNVENSFLHCPMKCLQIYLWGKKTLLYTVGDLRNTHRYHLYAGILFPDAHLFCDTGVFNYEFYFDAGILFPDTHFFSDSGFFNYEFYFEFAAYFARLILSSKSSSRCTA